MHKIISITLFSFLILFLILIGVISKNKTRGQVLKSIDLQGCKLLSQNEYFLYGNLKTDAELKNYSLSSLREKFLQHPYVSNVYIVVDADKKILMKIREKEFEAVAVLREKLFLVTSKKEFISVLPNTEVLDFPVLTNISDDVAEKGNEQFNELQSAFTIIHAAKNLGENLSQSISEINLHKGDDITLTLTHENSVIFLGKQNLTEKIYTLDALMKQIGNKVSLLTANYIDFRYANNIFISANENIGI